MLSTGRVWCRADRSTETGPLAHEVTEPERCPDCRRQYRAGRGSTTSGQSEDRLDESCQKRTGSGFAGD